MGALRRERCPACTQLTRQGLLPSPAPPPPAPGWREVLWGRGKTKPGSASAWPWPLHEPRPLSEPQFSVFWVQTGIDLGALLIAMAPALSDSPAKSKSLLKSFHATWFFRGLTHPLTGWEPWRQPVGAVDRARVQVPYATVATEATLPVQAPSWTWGPSRGALDPLRPIKIVLRA